ALPAYRPACRRLGDWQCSPACGLARSYTQNSTRSDLSGVGLIAVWPLNGKSKSRITKRHSAMITASAETIRLCAAKLSKPKKYVNPIVSTAPASRASQSGPGKVAEL